MENEIMIKSIYVGPKIGLYDPSKFEDFVLRRMETAIVFTRDFSKDLDANPLHLRIYHLSPKNVTLKYEIRNYVKDSISVTVTLFGNGKEVGEIEKLVLKEAERMEQNNHH